MNEQLALAILGTASVWCSYHDNDKFRVWAPWLGIAAQPIWIIACISAEQWGMVFLSFVYGGIFINAIWKRWRKGYATKTVS